MYNGTLNVYVVVPLSGSSCDEYCLFHAQEFINFGIITFSFTIFFLVLVVVPAIIIFVLFTATTMLFCVDIIRTSFLHVRKVYVVKPNEITLLRKWLLG